ncbi:MAG: ABC transporter ATP-binding protein [Acidisphaera sp.]|nr:ABC transporter ATP-binding protein [Acidisphaera sp.]MBV9813181.1 ABC transporter ATP-binding protein [Acetobacteraceae bacterium]
MSASSLVRLRQVGKTFSNGVRALAGLDLDIARGEFVSLLGPSGCGKSTALRLIAGLGTPSAGSVEWPGGRSDDVLSFVFQEPTLMPWRTVWGNVRLPLQVRGVSRAASEAPIREALERVGLTGFERAYPRQLSGGMKMRVSIARALVTRPALLLMDEPFAALDEITRARLNDDLLELWAAERLTVVFVTHSVYESVYLSTRIVVIAARPGRVVADIPVDAPHPRDDAFRTSDAYNRCCRVVSAALKTAMGENPPGPVASPREPAHV